MSARLYVYSVDLKDNRDGRRAQKESTEKITESAIWHLPLVHTAAGPLGGVWFNISCWQDKWPPKDKIRTQKNMQEQKKKKLTGKKGFLQKYKTYTRKGRQKMTENQPKLGGKNSGSQTSVKLCTLCLSPPATDSPPWFKVLRVLCNKRETVVIQRWNTRLTQTHKMIQLPIWMPTLTGCLTSPHPFKPTSMNSKHSYWSVSGLAGM